MIRVTGYAPQRINAQFKNKAKANNTNFGTNTNAARDVVSQSSKHLGALFEEVRTPSPAAPEPAQKFNWGPLADAVAAATGKDSPFHML